MDYQKTYTTYKGLLEISMDSLLDWGEISPLLKESMVYSAMNGGKRLRGVLVMAGADVFGVDQERAVLYGSAIEMIHAYSLIHDDLPCMDNDLLRRGMPSNHVQFGEANALLAGDGLLNYSYEVLLRHAKGEKDIEAMSYLAKSAGVSGMIKGQSLDMLSEEKEISFDVLQKIHQCKTGALIQAAIVIPALLAGAGGQEVAAAKSYGQNLGIAFQIADDILDEVGSQEQMGKTIGKDKESGKLTYVKLFGVDKSKEMAQERVNQAVSFLNGLPGDTSFLRETAQKMIDRVN